MATYETEQPMEPYVSPPEFDYSVWTPETVILLTNVPWDSSYRDIVRFETIAARNEWIRARFDREDSCRMTGFTYVKYGEPIMVPLPFSQVNQMNYLIAENPIQPITSPSEKPKRKPDSFFYFITGVEYVAPNTTAVTVQLDVWMTYYDRLEFGRCYITRGHIAHANANCTLYNLDKYLQDPEGLEYGDDYDIVNRQYINLINSNEAAPYVLIISNTDLASSFGTEDKPNLTTAKGSTIYGTPSGASAYCIQASDIQKFYTQLSKAPWVSQGIVSMTVVPYQFVTPFTHSTPVHLGGVSSNVSMWRTNPRTDNTTTYLIQNVFSRFMAGIAAEYQSYLKLWQFPYCFLEVTTYTGNPMVLKPQNMEVSEHSGDNNQYYQTSELYARCSLCPPNQTIKIYPKAYNSAGNDAAINESCWNAAGYTDNSPIQRGEFLDMCVEINDFPQLPVVNNMYVSYLASSANTRAWQFSNASWAQQKSLAAASNAYNLAQGSMANQSANQNVSNVLAMRQAGIAQEQNTWSGIKGIASGGANAIGSLVSGNVGGALGGAASAGMAYLDMAANSDWLARTTTNQLAAANQTLGNNLQYQQQVADTNLSYANFAANGDYQQAIQGIQATVRDAALTQPSVSGQLSSGGFNWANCIIGIDIKWKRIKPQYIAQLGQYFQRYGYYVNRFLVPPQNLKCMTKFTYWQMQNCQLFGNIPENFKQAIRGIFESGVTVWTNPDEIGRISYDQNAKVSGVSY